MLSPVVFSATRDSPIENKTYNLENGSVLRRIFYSNQSPCKKITEPFALTGDIFCRQGRPHWKKKPTIWKNVTQPMHVCSIEAPSMKCRCLDSMVRGAIQQPHSVRTHSHTYAGKAGVVPASPNVLIFCCIVFGFHTSIYMHTHVSSHSTK